MLHNQRDIRIWHELRGQAVTIENKTRTERTRTNQVRSSDEKRLTGYVLYSQSVTGVQLHFALNHSSSLHLSCLHACGLCRKLYISDQLSFTCGSRSRLRVGGGFARTVELVLSLHKKEHEKQGLDVPQIKLATI